ncbi:uncharacterized protein LOC109598446 [Aethina tumida]|uniref:uncharacterized protein LOC109598446 n=1 Tax=Aethina tumida TaxID=116153 RepID=UPI00096B5F0A|nr:uncharacterized protein LOC109598446 [Aethina tumida]
MPNINKQRREMLPIKSDSFSFRRNTSANSSSSSTRSAGMENCRKNLQDKFDGDDSKSNDRSVLSALSFNVNTRKVLRNGAERISKTFNTVRTTFGSISQKFKISTKRREILEEGPMTPNCATPDTLARQILGRTPVKLYSPFGFDSPYNSTTYDKENQPLNTTPMKYRR